MHFASALTVAMSALSGLASAQKIHVVSVGIAGTKELAFKPNTLKVPTGDMIQFQFLGGNHSVVQSNFDNPCVPISMTTPGSAGIFSGYQPVTASAGQGQIPTWTIQVNNTDPMWLYCSAKTHCQGGMSLVVNEDPSKNKTRTLTEYKKIAATAPQNIGGDGIVSGTVGGSSTGGKTNSGGSSSSAAGSSPTASAGEAATTPSAGHMLVVSSGWMGLAGVAASFLML